MSVRIRTTAVLAALTLAMPTWAPARQDDASPQIGEPTTRIASVSPFVDETHPLSVVAQIVNTSETTIESVGLRVSLHGVVFSRSQLRQALDVGVNTSTLITFTETLPEEIEPGAGARIRIERTAEEIGVLSRTGVHPVEIGIAIDGDETVRRTAIPYLSEAPETRLNLTWLLPAARPTALRGDGTYAGTALDLFGLSRMRQQLDVLATRPGIPVTFIPEGSFVDSLADLADGFRRTDGAGVIEQVAGSGMAAEAAELLETMRGAAAVVGEVASTPYTPANLTALTRHGPQSDVVRQITASRAAVEEHLGRTPTFRFLGPTGDILGAGEVSTLTTLGVEGIVVDPRALPTLPTTPVTHPALRYDLFGPSRPALLRADADRVDALLVDLDLRARLEGDEQGVLMAQSLIAESASSWLEIPSFAPERVLVLASAEMPHPPALAAALDGLAAAPWVQLRTASDALALLPAASPAISIPRRRGPDTSYLASARTAREALATLAEILVEPHPQAAALERMTLLAESSEWEEAPGVGEDLAGQATLALAQIKLGIKAVPRVVTLTSRTGAVPITLLNETGLDVRARVRLESPKATFPDGDSRTIVLAQQATLDFTVEALATGSFPLVVLVESPGGTETLARSRVVLRSTAVSAVALAAVGGGILFLLLGTLRRRRRSGPRDDATRHRGPHRADEHD